jgi:hypothetical protein
VAGFRRQPPVVRLRDRLRADGDARRAGSAVFLTTIQAPTPLDAMTTRARLTLEACERRA